MVSIMVETFREMQLRLADTIEQYETPEFKVLDGNIAAVFQDLYRHAPRNIDEARTLIDFFLDIIQNNDAGDNIHLIERVRAIVGDCPSPSWSSMEIAHGAGI